MCVTLSLSISGIKLKVTSLNILSRSTVQWTRQKNRPITPQSRGGRTLAIRMELLKDGLRSLRNTQVAGRGSAHL